MLDFLAMASHFQNTSPLPPGERSTRKVYPKHHLSPGGRGRPAGPGEGEYNMTSRFPVYLISIIFLGISITASAWNAIGHKVIAHIAYDYLTPNAKEAVDKLTKQKNNEQFSGRSRFAFISTWADYIRAKGDHRFDRWHYIGLPLSADGTPIKPPRTPNVVWAIKKSGSVLVDPKSSKSDKRLHLKLLVHFVGDVHQPLHAVNRYSRATPQGDRGGNAMKISAPYAKNLHAYWDDGVGLFRKMGVRYPRKNTNIRRVASIIEQKTPIQNYPPKLLNTSPMDWGEESRKLARRFAYKLKANQRPTQGYVMVGQRVVENRLALAGYRLATMLNEIYG